MRRHIVSSIVIVLAMVWFAMPADEESTVHAATLQNNGGTVHTVGLGETLYSIARRYGISAEALAAHNGIANPNYIYAGQQLFVPGSTAPSWGHGRPVQAAHSPGGSHTVGLGETLYSIALRYGTTVSALLDANGLANPDYIYAGQQLVIPGSGPTYDPGHGNKGWSQGCGHYYTVDYGDTLSGIAWRHGTTVYAMARANGLHFPYMVYAGQSLHVPCDGGTPKRVHVGQPAPPKHHHAPKPAPKPAPKKAQPKLRPAACAREVQIVSPKNREHVSGTIDIIGTASVENFQFYKIEYAMGEGALDSNFHSINDVHNTPVTDSVLGTWYTGNMPAGTYTLRLTAVYNTGNIARPCDVVIHIDR